MDFGIALAHLKRGDKVRRAVWADKDMYIHLQTPDSLSKMTHPYLYISNVGILWPWSPGQTDMLAEDWSVIGG